MADCICLPKCPFFLDKMASMPAMSDIYKARYCKGDSAECARYAVYRKMGPGSVPSGLFPNDMVQAGTFLADSGY